MSQSLANPWFVPPGTTFPLDGTENMIILQGEFVPQARLNDIIHASRSSYSLPVNCIDKIFVNYNGPCSIYVNTLFVVAGQEILIADRGGFASTGDPITIIASSGTFDGDTSIVLNNPYGRVRLYYDGTNFIVTS